ncbi:MAG: nucleotide exchange factor GrpE [Endomicrobiaceae bacterium]|nr:nucleotide exchange factor GrpE [Endomicrobiaceae bacterium]
MTSEEQKKVEKNIEPTTVEEIAREEKLSELDILRQSVEEKQKKADEYYDQLLRLKADFENFRRRTEKEKQDFLNWGREKILIKQIGIYDVFEQALQSVKAGKNLDSIMVGLDMIHKEFAKMLKEEGVEKIECLNKKFDPHFCEALAQVESDKEDGTILEVYQQGYKCNGKLMRPAKVKIAKTPETKKSGGSEAGKLSNDNNGKELGNDENKEENKE